MRRILPGRTEGTLFAAITAAAIAFDRVADAQSSHDLSPSSVPPAAAQARAGSRPRTNDGPFGIWWTPGRDVTFVRGPNVGLSLGGYAQLVARSDVDDHGTHTASAYFQRLRPQLRGYLFAPWIVVQCSGEFGSGTPSIDARPDLSNRAPPVFAPRPYLLDAFVTIAPRPEIGIRFGQYKTPFSRAFIITALGDAFTDYSLVTRAFIPNRDLGGEIRGSIGHGIMNYNIGVFNGGGRLDQLVDNHPTAPSGQRLPNATGEAVVHNYANSGYDFSTYGFRGSLLIARIESQPLGPMGDEETDFAGGPLRIHLAANVLRGERHYGATTTPPAGLLADFVETTGGVEAGLKLRGLAIHAEGYLRQRVAPTGPGIASAGGFAQAGYNFFGHRFEIAGRYSFMRPVLDRGPSETEGTNADRHIIEGIISVFVDPNRLKLSGQYRFDSHAVGTARVNTSEFFLYVQCAL